MKARRLVFVAAGEVRPNYEHFLPTLTPEYLGPTVRVLYMRLRPDLPGCKQEFEEDTVRLDVPGPIYDGRTVGITMKRGYTVECPLTHADAVASHLQEYLEREPHEICHKRLVIFHCMYHLAVLPFEDLEELIEGFSTHALAAQAQREVVRATVFA